MATGGDAGERWIETIVGGDRECIERWHKAVELEIEKGRTAEELMNLLDQYVEECEA